MYFHEVILLLTIGQAMVRSSIIPTAIEISSINISSLPIFHQDSENRTAISCKAGTYLIEADKDICSPCLPGHFMSSENHRSTQCAPCSKPRPSLGEVLLETCNATQDTVIGCASDFYLHGNRCTHCRHCVSNDSSSGCAISCCRTHVNATDEGGTGSPAMHECLRWKQVLESGSNDWRIVFIVGLVSISLFSLFICIWRGVIKSGNRAGKIGCFRYKRVRTMSNSM
ncbi:tumor necrosis factor receptor superfamily member 5 [Biomphalaria glabrata]|nr:tumor necrosis factor receptor superfamily member 5-like [Biomphalaria glabrata]